MEFCGGSSIICLVLYVFLMIWYRIKISDFFKVFFFLVVSVWVMFNILSFLNGILFYKWVFRKNNF